jgi:hypothetical protein
MACYHPPLICFAHVVKFVFKTKQMKIYRVCYQVLILTTHVFGSKENTSQISIAHYNTGSIYCGNYWGMWRIVHSELEQ